MLATHSATSGVSSMPQPKLFCDFSPAVSQALQSIECTTYYPTGAVLFVESQPSQGVYFLSRGRIKLSVCARNGKTFILRVAEAGDAVGVGAAVCNRPYEATAETLERCAISFIRQSDVLRLMRQYNEFAIRMAEHLSREYNSTCREIRSRMHFTASGRLARFLVGWLDKNGEAEVPGQMKLVITHEEIAEMIGTSRETVTRLFTQFKRKQFIQRNGVNLVVRDRAALESMMAP
jgi:CRP/FNR family transcriptional regulator, cyclic AMP receptor protein